MTVTKENHWFKELGKSCSLAVGRAQLSSAGLWTNLSPG